MAVNLNNGRERSRWIQVRVSEDELATVKALAGVYDLEVSDFIRYAIRWIDDKRPEMRIAPRRAVV